MIKTIEIQNYLSIVKASIPLSPFTLLIGANGTGKTNFLRILQQLPFTELTPRLDLEKHVNYQKEPQRVLVTDISGSSTEFGTNDIPDGKLKGTLENITLFSLDPMRVGQAEKVISTPTVQETGEGVVQVLDALKTGDREDLFYRIEQNLQRYVPEIEKLSFITHEGTKQLQIRDRYLQKPFPASQLSEGTKFVIAMLTIIFQEQPPSVICFEEIDRGLHPRLLEKIFQLCFDITNKPGMPQIVATTHNPYLVDQFKDHEDAVIIVEKTEGETEFTSLAERVQSLAPDEEPLGQLWFSGFVGGVPTQGA